MKSVRVWARCHTSKVRKSFTDSNLQGMLRAPCWLGCDGRHNQTLSIADSLWMEWQLAVGSWQWAVGSGQWAVGRGQLAVVFVLLAKR
jgi:hypothetical protein